MTHIMSVHPYLWCPVFSSRVVNVWDHALTTPRFSAAISVLPEKTETVQEKIAGSFPRTTAGNRGLRSANILGKTCTVGCNSRDTKKYVTAFQPSGWL